jgi:hypothetical protein
MNALKRVSTSTGVVSTVARATGRLDVHGAAAGAVWIADNRSGILYRISETLSTGIAATQTPSVTL